MRSSALAFVLVGVFAGCGGPGTPAAPTVDATQTGTPATIRSRYTVVELPSVEGVAALQPAAINARGDVAGSYVLERSYNPPTHAFFYDAASRTSRRIGDDGASSSQWANGLNDAGQVAVQVESASRARSYRWEAGVLTPLDDGYRHYAGSDTYASGITPAGEIFGCTAYSYEGNKPLVWAGQVGQVVGGGAGCATGKDASGRFYGTRTVGAVVRVVRFDGKASTDLGPLDQFVVRGGLVDLSPASRSEIFADRLGDLVAANSAGDAVGAYFEVTWTPARAVLWRHGVIVDLTASLGDPSWVLVSATATNDAGQIAGVGLHDGVRVGYVLTPAKD